MALSNDMRKVLQKLGEPVTLTRVTEGTFGPATGTSTPDSTVELSGYGVAEPYDTAEIDGTNVLRTDSKITLSKLDQRPEVGDRVLMDGKTYRVMMVYPVRFGGADVVYQVQGRV